MKTLNPINSLTICALALLAACAAPPPPAPAPVPDTRAADEAAIRAADAAWSKAAEAKQADVFVGYYSPDAMVLPANMPLTTGKPAITTLITGFMAMPGFSLKFETAKVEVARSGDIAWSHGSYDMAVNDAKGKPVNEHGKFLEIWKKQADGGWKCAVDTFNADAPPASPAPPAK